MKLNKIFAALAVAGIAAPVWATNGMNMDGYGPISTAMGGASLAYDNGNAGTINNPATLGFMKSGSARLDIAVGILGPDVKSNFTGFPGASSSGDSYLMPAMGYIRKSGNLAYGVGMFAQGGMGTEYGTNTFLSLGSGREVRSELGVGRLIFPLAYSVNDALNIGGSIDYVWAGLDLRMPMSLAGMGAMMAPGGSALGNIVMTPVLGVALPGAITGTTYGGYFDFSNTNKFSGSAHATGYAGNLGFTYKVSQQLTVGAVYHSKTSLGDLETDTNASLTLLDTAGDVPFAGKIKIKNFQWPETYGFGFSYQANDRLLVALDYKRIRWSGVMKNFVMEFSPNAIPGETMTATLYQNWSDQDVFGGGVSYSMNDALTLRAGFNYGKNPIPSAYLNALFPAITTTHYTVGAGYKLSKDGEVNFSMTYVPEVTQTNSAAAAIGGGVETKMSQTNWQLMYSHRF